MASAKGISIVNPILPGQESNDQVFVKGSYNNPFTPGSLEYDGYSKAHNISQGIQSGINNIKTFGSAVSSAAKDIVQDTIFGFGDGSGVDPNGVDWIGYYENGINPFATSASADIPETPQPYAFMDTSLASMFGMDSATHYQEALANTAHHRQVRDLLAAGLNPVLGISGSGAQVFRGVEGPANHLVSGVTSGSSGSGGTSYGSSGSGKTISELGSKIYSAAPYLVNGFVTLATKNPAYGYAAQNLVYQAQRIFG